MNKKLIFGLFIAIGIAFVSYGQEHQHFPYKLPKEKPDIPLSRALHRNYDNYMAPRPEDNELYTQFKYTPVTFDYSDHDGTVSRRDPTKVIFEKGKYYVWYTHRKTATPPRGAKAANDTIPSTDWDLSEIWYATSEDGFHWVEQGVAVPRPPKPNLGHRSVSTPDVLKWKNKYYMYYQGFSIPSGTRGDDCPVLMSFADSPDGPWTAVNKIIIPNGPAGTWDQFSIHDPHPLVYKDKIYLYYKSDLNGRPENIRMQGLAIADNPFGPFEKHPLNPVLNSGHETALFPFKEGIAAMMNRDGNEHNTIQYAPDGVNFDIASIVDHMPIAAGCYTPDAFTNTTYGRGITWGMSHFTNYNSWSTNHAILVRFDCDLSLDMHDKDMKKHHAYQKADFYYSLKLTGKQRKERETKKPN